jgi:hypothetical protein
MSKQELRTPAGLAILTLVEIKAASEAFDKGEANVYDILDAIVAAIEAYHAAEQRRRKAA